MSNSNQIFFPGQAIATIEEAESSTGTFEENGVIFAAAVGRQEHRGKSEVVENPKSKRLLQRGDLIYATVADVFDAVAMLAFKPADPRVTCGEDRAFLKIFEVQERSKGFVESFRDFIKIGDVLKAKIVDITPLGVYVTIAPRGLGVIRAFCSSCRSELDKNITCPNCGRRERRKIA